MNEALTLVEPSMVEAEKVARVADGVRMMVDEECRRRRVDIQVVLGGSFAKGTWLKEEADIDLFMKFPVDIGRAKLEELSIEIGCEALKGFDQRLRYAEHPYVEAYVEDVRVNIVGCFDVEKGFWRSAADRSPYHTELIVGRFDDSLRKEARLLKRFMKSIGVYGAEVAIQGFSGYVCEVLVLKYGSFASILKAASKFKERHVVGVDGFDEDYVKLMKSPLIILDPVDPRRNLGAAISPENVGRFILSSRAFLDEPDLKYFTRLTVDDHLAKLKASSLSESIVAATFTHKERSVDILWGQLKRSVSHLHRQLEVEGFDVVRSRCGSDGRRNSAFLFLMSVLELPRDVVKMGPKVFMEKDAASFLAKNSSAKLLWIGGDARLYALVDRRYRSVKLLLSRLLSRDVSGSGVAPGLAGEVAESSKVYMGKEVLEAAERAGWMAEACYELVCRDGFGIRIRR